MQKMESSHSLAGEVENTRETKIYVKNQSIKAD